MPRIDSFNELPGNLSIHVYVDHLPPHFHVRSPQSNAKIEIASLRVLRGRISRKDYEAACEWASRSENKTALERHWRALNDQD